MSLTTLNIIMYFCFINKRIIMIIQWRLQKTNNDISVDLLNLANIPDTTETIRCERTLITDNYFQIWISLILSIKSLLNVIQLVKLMSFQLSLKLPCMITFAVAIRVLLFPINTRIILLITPYPVKFHLSRQQTNT